MHKDRPPGIFDFADRSVRYLVGFWFTSGLILSILVHTGLLIWRADAKELKQDSDTLEVKAASHKSASVPAPPATDAVKY